MNKNIKVIIDKINILNNKELNNIKKSVDCVIQNNVKSINTIERLFDKMLSLVFVDDTILKPIYFKLLNYYKSINEQHANEYEKFFIEQFGKEKVKKYE